ncbi:hypothetical protein [Agromyces laixinhei]|uniref:hypothetical protein n=1 Tax=Agromyces laixinhei TaxID=2585717 RepID=UPI001117A408|nr:hypothetical protein [Agromyces laixinhei]
MSTHNDRLPDEEPGAYVDSELPEDAVTSQDESGDPAHGEGAGAEIGANQTDARPERDDPDGSRRP